MTDGKAFAHGVGLAVMAGGAVASFAAPVALLAYGFEPGVFMALFAPSVAAILAGAGLATWAKPRLQPGTRTGSAKPSHRYRKSSAGEDVSLTLTPANVATIASLSSVSIALGDGGSCGSHACGC